ncbi:hypothetical protein N7468_001806 [Penicillium chermesinum]|uniref:Maltose/galactoside acetyltransferase domain-containing protein n=1 Tax=Penicillium chermesinum TaxID=63820 RepID=A0A9W9PJG3_9EURO|nr:uncharacterized protein N7468_001806 [Penicillium chermesinum]KAJ5246823.1 hypothetical protein N7468_001806 [Penicillium chermesinum]
MARVTKSQEFIELAKRFGNTPWCDDYEKMISGMLYDSFVPELVEGRLRARKLIKKYNDYLPDEATPESLARDREAMLAQLLGCVGKGVDLDPPLRVDYGCNIIVGDGVYANFGLVVLDCAIVRIGDRTILGPNVHIYAATHPTSVKERREIPDYSKEVTIGDDCWIGGNSVIMPGVAIGNGVTVGACSVVTKDIPSYSVALGSPAKVVKTLDEAER